MGLQQIKVACDVSDRIDIDDLVEIQGNLKNLSDNDYQRLRNEILETGFAFPFLVWRDKRAKKIRLVGGHQRLNALRKMRDEGISIPKMPFISIHAASEQEAKRRVLQDVAQYGKLTPDGLYDFMKGANLSFDKLQASFVLPDFDISQFKDSYFTTPDEVSFKAKKGSKELNESEFSEFQHTCPKCGFGWGQK